MQPLVRADPAGTARRALDAVASAGRLVVHFDVDAVDSGDLPLANFPHYGTGVPLATAAEALSVLFAAPTLAAVVLTEVNPSYAPPVTRCTATSMPSPAHSPPASPPTASARSPPPTS